MELTDSSGETTPRDERFLDWPLRACGDAHRFGFISGLQMSAITDHTTGLIHLRAYVSFISEVGIRRTYCLPLNATKLIEDLSSEFAAFVARKAVRAHFVPGALTISRGPTGYEIFRSA